MKGRKCNKVAASTILHPPTYPQVPHELTFHGHTRFVPYHWLRNKSNPAVKQLLQKENTYLKHFLHNSPIGSVKQAIYTEMKVRWKETDITLPTKHRSYWYLVRTVEGLDHSIMTRAPYKGNEHLLQQVAEALEKDPTQVPVVDGEVSYIDLNRLRVELGLDYIECGDVDISPCQQQALVSIDCSNGAEIFTIFVLDLDAPQHAAESPSVTIDKMKLEPQRETANASPEKSKCRTKGSKLKGQKRSTFPKSKNSSRPENGAASAGAGAYHRILHRIELYDNASDVLWGSPDSILYCPMDDSQRPFGVVLHHLPSLPAVGEDANADQLVFDEEDLTFWVGGLCHSEDEAFVMFSTSSKTSEEWHFAPKPAVQAWPRRCREADDGETASSSVSLFSVFYPRTEHLEYDLSHHSCFLSPDEGAWIVVNNGNGKENFGVDYVLDGLDTACMDNWRPLITYDVNIKVDSVVCSKDYLIVSCRTAGLPSAYYVSVKTIRAATLPLAFSDLVALSSEFAAPNNAGAAVVPCRVADCIDVSFGCDDFDSTSFWVCVSNMVFPFVLYNVQVNPSDHSLMAPFCLRREHVPGAPYNPADYTVERVWVPITVSTLHTHPSCPQVIPMILCYKTSLFSAGTNPMLISVYGSYGDSSDPHFTAERLSLLERGFVYALASVRGGGELGRVWRDAGRMGNRRNSITDMVACAEFAIEHKYCSPTALAITGGSAGGSVVAGAMNIKPHLFNAVLALVPFVDCLTSMLDPDIPLTTAEWEEWGNPIESEEAYRTILEYSPMDNIPLRSTNSAALSDGAKNRGPEDTVAKATVCDVVFPHIFVESGYSDPRVAYWEPAAFVAHLRGVWGASAASGRVLVHKCNMDAGHGGSSGRYEQLEELATEYAFIVAASNITK